MLHASGHSLSFSRTAWRGLLALLAISGVRSNKSGLGSVSAPFRSIPAKSGCVLIGSGTVVTGSPIATDEVPVCIVFVLDGAISAVRVGSALSSLWDLVSPLKFMCALNKAGGI